MNRRGESPFLVACSFGLYEQIKLMVPQYGANLSLCDPFTKETGLHKLLKTNASIIPISDLKEITQLLINFGVDVNARDAFGKAPLHIAAELGLSTLVAILLNSNQIDPNLPVSSNIF